MRAIDPSQTPLSIVAAAGMVAQHMLQQKHGAAYTYIVKRDDGCPKAILLCFTGDPRELERVLLAVQAATQEGR